MGTILVNYGDAGYDHEGYAAQVLADGTLTSEYSNNTRPRMIGAVVAACDCGWHGTRRYPTREPFDEAAHELALAEWETQHALPTLRGAAGEQREALVRLLREIGAGGSDLTGDAFAGRSRTEQLARIDWLLAQLACATDLAGQVREPLTRRPR